MKVEYLNMVTMKNISYSIQKNMELLFLLLWLSLVWKRIHVGNDF